MAQSLTQLLASVAGSSAADPAVVELARELTAEEARFNRWAYERKPRSTAAELWNISAQATRYRAEVEAAWNGFAEPGGDRAGRAALLGAMAAARDGLRHMRETDTVEFDDPSMPPEFREWM